LIDQFDLVDETSHSKIETWLQLGRELCRLCLNV